MLKGWRLATTDIKENAQIKYHCCGFETPSNDTSAMTPTDVDPYCDKVSFHNSKGLIFRKSYFQDKK